MRADRQASNELHSVPATNSLSRATARCRTTNMLSRATAHCRTAVGQSKDYDLNGDYVRTWCPELRNVPTSKVHEPWTMSKEEQEKAGCRCVLAHSFHSGLGGCACGYTR